MKTYKYNKRRYFVEHNVTNILAIFIILVSIYNILNNFLPVLMVLALISAIYSVINNYIFKMNTEVITIEENQITFEAYGKKDVFNLQEIQKIKLKEYPTNGKIYARVYDENNKMNRYWIHTRSFQDGKELFIHLLYIEFKKHPETLKASSQSESFFKESISN